MDPSFNLMLERSLAEGLRAAGISDLLIDELAMAVMRVNYGQLVDAHQFVGIYLTSIDFVLLQINNKQFYGTFR